MITSELLPFGFIRVSGDNRIDIHGTVTPRCGDKLFLGHRDHGMQVLRFVLKYFDELHHTAVTNIESAVEIKHPWIALGVHVQLRYILGTNEY